MAEESLLQQKIIAYVKMFEDDSIMLIRHHTQGVKQLKGYVKNPNKGMADLQIIVEGKSIWVELKAKKGVQSEDQKKFAQKVIKAGCTYFVCNEFEQFLDIFTKHVIDGDKQKEKLMRLM